jgi:hypothetical protein
MSFDTVMNWLTVGPAEDDLNHVSYTVWNDIIRISKEVVRLHYDRLCGLVVGVSGYRSRGQG